MHAEIHRLAKRLGGRQQAIATAQLYIKRFYTKVEIRRTNPYLVLTTAYYLASKMEETPQHIRLIATEARSLWGAECVSMDVSKLGECEFFLISEMNSQMIVHQPYRTLTALQAEFNMSPDESAVAWSIINDSYMTDLPFLYPPHIVALTAILLALVTRPQTNPQGQGGAGGNGPATSAANASAGLQAATAALAQAQARAAMSGSGGSGSNTPNLTPQSSAGLQGLGGLPSYQGSNDGGAAGPPGTEKKAAQDPRWTKVQRFAIWLAESNIEVDAVVDSVQEMLSFYECWESFNEKVVREQIARFIKARGLDK
jgi:cyclin-C